MRAEKERESAQRQKEAAAIARRIWMRAKPAEPGHPYLGKKQIRPHGLRLDGRGDLLVPMRDMTGKVQNVQTIKSDAKLYMKDAVKTGLHLRLGDLRPGE